MAKWGIQSDQELGDIVTILQTVMRSQFQRLRPKWSQQFGEDVLDAIEQMPTFWPSSPAMPIAQTSTPHQSRE